MCAVIPDLFGSVSQLGRVDKSQGWKRGTDDLLCSLGDPLQVFPLLRGAAGEPHSPFIALDNLYGALVSSK